MPYTSSTARVVVPVGVQAHTSLAGSTRSSRHNTCSEPPFGGMGMLLVVVTCCVNPTSTVVSPKFQMHHAILLGLCCKITVGVVVTATFPLKSQLKSTPSSRFSSWKSAHVTVKPPF